MKRPFISDGTIGWAIVRVSMVTDTSGLNLIFNRVESRDLFPGLAGQTIHFEGTVYRQGLVFPAEDKYKDHLVRFKRLDMYIPLEHGKEYAILMLVDSQKTIRIKLAALKVHFDAALSHMEGVRDANMYHIKFASGLSFTGSFERLYKAAILQVQGHPEAFLYNPGNEWYIKESDGEFHRILVFPSLPTINRMFINSVLRGGIDALPPK